MLSVNTNIASNYGQYYSGRAETAQQNSMLNLSSGSRVNSSADDAVGLAVSNKILSTIKGLNSSAKNTANGISLSQLAQNSASQISEMIIRLRELAIQNHNGVYTEEDRNNSQHEVSALLYQIDQISNHTTFNTKKLLDGTFFETLRTGNLNTENMLLNFRRLSTDSLGGVRVPTLNSEFLNVEPSFDIKNMTRISIHESEKININTSIMSVDFQNFVSSSPDGKFRIDGPDAGLFSINSKNGALVSNEAITHTENAENQNKYKINVSYEAPSGAVITELLRLRVEEVLPKISEIKTASSQLTSQEAQNVTIQAMDFPSGSNNSILSSALKNFMNANSGGIISLVGNDASNFTINSDGKVTGNLNYNSPQDLDQNNIYDFSLKYSLPNGDSFLEEITLAIQGSVPPSSLGTHNVSTEEIVTGSNLDLNAIVTKENSPGVFDPQMTTIDLDNGSLTFGSFFQNFSSNFGSGGSFSIRNISYNGPNVFDPLIHNISVESGNILTLGGPTLSDAIPFGDYFADLVYSSGGEEFTYDLQLFADPGNGPSVSIFSSDTMPSKSKTSFQNITIGNEDLEIPILQSPVTQFSMINQISGFAPNGILSIANITTPPGGNSNHLSLENNKLVINNNAISGTYTADITYSVGANSVTTSANFSITGRPPLPCENDASNLVPSTLTTPTSLFREDNGTVLETFISRASNRFQATEAKILSFSILDDTDLTSTQLRSFMESYPGGDFALTGDDSKHLKVNDAGTIYLNENADFERKRSYDFIIEYRTEDKNFKNNITIDLIDNVVDNSPRLSDVNISTSRGAQQAVLITNKALEQINSFQAYAGASENRLQKSLDLISKNLETAKISRGRIIDSDFAVETTQLAVAQIIMQSSQSIILQANTAKQNLLTLIE